MEATNPLDDFLRSAQTAPPSKCRICQHEPAAAAIKEFLKRVAAKEPSVQGVSLRYLHNNFIRGRLGLMVSPDTTYRHVQLCLRMSGQTGLPLEP